MATFPHFDIVRGVAIDPMHGIYGGVTKALISLWFDTCHHSQPWYCKSKLLKVNECLQKISPTYETTKCTRSLDQRKYWKGMSFLPQKLVTTIFYYAASEYQYFLLFYSLPCMRDVLPASYYKNLQQLVIAIYILNKNSICDEDLDYSKKLLIELHKTFVNLYGMCTHQNLLLV